MIFSSVPLEVHLEEQRCTLYIPCRQRSLSALPPFLLWNSMSQFSILLYEDLPHFSRTPCMSHLHLLDFCHVLFYVPFQSSLCEMNACPILGMTDVSPFILTSCPWTRTSLILVKASWTHVPFQSSAARPIPAMSYTCPDLIPLSTLLPFLFSTMSHFSQPA